MRVLLALFFGSGALALGYQVLWSRWLLHLIGASAPTHAVVLAAFMGGLALGARWLGPIADRSRSPLRLYAVLELALVAWAAAWPLLMELAESVAGGRLGLEGRPALLARAGLACALLLPPTLAMGGTWPAVVRHAVRSPAAVGRRGAGLYAVNAAGAVLGALAMAYVLLPGLGLGGSLAALAAGNALVAVVALVVAGRRPAGGAARERGHPPVAPAVDEAPPPFLLLAVVLFVAGTLSFVHEIAWTRLFAIALGSSTYSFAVMLASFVAGIALGSALLARFDHLVRRPMRLLAWTQLGAGAFVLLVLPAGQHAPWLAGRLGAALTTSVSSFALNELAKLIACGAVLLPLALLVGVSIPLALKALARRPETVGLDAGRLYAANTWGNVVGALAAGLLLLPLLGTERLLAWTASGSLALGLAILLGLDASRRDRVAALGLVLAAAAWAVATPRWNAAWFTLTPARDRVPTFAEARAFVERWEVLLERDDPAAHVLVAQVRGARPTYRVLFVDGKPDASSGGDMPTQLLLAHVPLVLHPEARDVLVVGLASGVTAGAALQHPIERLEVVDLVGAMADVSALFEPWNARPLEDPRTRFVVDDGNSRIRHGDRRHDVIVSEPSNPWVVGVGSLFSRELYEAARGRLRPDGCFVQWLQAYELSDETLACVVRTFRLSFPHVRIFHGAHQDLLLLGRLSPFDPNWAAVSERASLPGVARDLERAGIGSLDELLDREMLSPPSVDWLASLVGVVNTDANLLLEHRAPRDLFAGVSPTVVRRLDERPFAAASLLRWKRDGVVRPEAAGAPSPAAARQALGSSDPAVVAGWLREHGAPVLAAVRRDPALGQAWVRALAEWVPGDAGAATAAAWHLFRVDCLAAAGRLAEARAALSEAVRSPRPPSVEAAVLRACRFGPADSCDAAIARELARRPDDTLRRLAALRAGEAAR
jgi:predicted membrane-bound spermidine synthase